MSDRLHTFQLPSGRKLVIRETTVDDEERILEDVIQMAGGADAGPAALSKAQMRVTREQALLQYGNQRVGDGVTARDLIRQMKAHERELLDKAITDVNEPTADEVKAFFASHNRQPEEAQTTAT